MVAPATDGGDMTEASTERAHAAFDHAVRNSINAVLVSLEALRASLARCDSVPPATTRFLDVTATQCQELAQLLATGSRGSAPDSNPTSQDQTSVTRDDPANVA